MRICFLRPLLQSCKPPVKTHERKKRDMSAACSQSIIYFWCSTQRHRTFVLVLIIEIILTANLCGEIVSKFKATRDASWSWTRTQFKIRAKIFNGVFRMIAVREWRNLMNFAREWFVFCVKPRKPNFFFLSRGLDSKHYHWARNSLGRE